MKRLLTLLILLAAPAWGATYYVKNGGSDAASGLSDALAWETIAKVNGSSFSPGDSILFKKGSTWREQLTAPSSGSAGLPITFGAYGSGAAPIISGANNITTETWTQATSGATVTGTIVANLDDAHEVTGGALVDSNQVAFGYNSTTIVGMVFNELVVPKDATIISSKITFTCCVNGTNDTVNARFYGENAAAPVTFVDKTDFDARKANLTTGYANWNAVEHWTLDSTYDSPDLSTIIDELTSLSGWVNGNNICIFIKDNGSTNSSYRQARSKDATHNTGLAVLSVTYGEPIANVYYTTALSADPNSVWLDGVSYPEAASAAAVNSTNRWFWSAGDTRLYVYATSDPNGFYSDIEAPVRDFALNDWNKSYHTYDGIHFRYAKSCVVKMDPPGTGYVFRNCSMEGDGYRGALWINADNTIVEDCTITGGNRDGIDTLKIGSHDQYTDGAQVRRCTLRNGHHVLMSSFNAQNFVIEHNDVKNEDGKWGRCFEFEDDGTHGGNIFRYNRVEGSYISDESGANGGNTISGINNAIYGNVFLTGDADALQIHASTIEEVDMPTINIKVYNNVFYNYTHEGIRLEDHGRTTSGNLIENNIIMNCGTAESTYTQASANNLAVDILSDSTPAAYTLRNNAIYSSATTSTVYDGSAARTVAYMESNDPTHWSANIVADPLFTNAAGGDFTLQAGSPCIDAGVDLGSTYQLGLMPASSWPASVLTASQYNAGQKWECGAYLFPNKRQSLIIVGK